MIARNTELLLISYGLFSLIYIGIWFRKSREEGFFRLILAAFFPGFGYLLLFLLWISGKYIKSGSEYSSTERDQYLKPESALKAHVMSGKELNLIPMEEALILNNNNIKRRMLLDILKEDMCQYPKLLSMALDNEDSETSHYAVTALVELRDRISLSIQEMASQYESGKRNTDFLLLYANTLRECLNDGLTDKDNTKKLKSIYREVLMEILEVHTLNEIYFIDRINLDLEVKDYDSAGFYCDTFMKIHCQSEQPYIMFLKLYYSLRDQVKFNEFLIRIQKSPGGFSGKTWDIINFWV